MAKKIANPNSLYALRFAGDREASEIVMNVETDREGFQGICYLTPPDRGHMIDGKMGDRTKDGFTFITADRQEEWEFIEVTYDNFKSKYHKLAYGGDQLLRQVNNTRELEDYYHDNFPDYT